MCVYALKYIICNRIYNMQEDTTYVQYVQYAPVDHLVLLQQTSEPGAYCLVTPSYFSESFPNFFF